MQLTFNEHTIDTQASHLRGLLDEQGLSSKTGIAVAVNDSVVQRSRWEEHVLKENDNVLVITAAAGG